jgi:hypothetical protein
VLFRSGLILTVFVVVPEINRHGPTTNVTCDDVTDVLQMPKDMTHTEIGNL